MIRISLYWKCQLIGWALYAILVYLLNYFTNPKGGNFIIRSLIVFSFGICFTHFLRILIIWLKVFEKSFAQQLAYLFLLTAGTVFLSSYLFTYLIFITNVREISWGTFFIQSAHNLFQVFLSGCGWSLIYFLVHYIRRIRKEEQEKAELKINFYELEARALRAQMNPHFIFNCMNSIKALIQQDEKDKAVSYLTNFSKLIRTIFQNSDKREITLFDEIETCRLYTQLEAMRFKNKLSYSFSVDEKIDLKSIMVPALIIQPFIENGIWHGIMPSENGGTVRVSVEQKEDNIYCIIEDDGIGREVSQPNRFKVEATTHQSKGIHLTQSRLDLNNALNQGNASVEIIDKKDAEGKATGTLVIVSFNEY